MAISSRFWSPWERIEADISCFSASPTCPRMASASAATVGYRRASPNASRLFPWWEKSATWTFSKTVIRGKMLVIWKERPIPFRMIR